MSEHQVQRQETNKMVCIIAAVLALFIGGSAVTFGMISSDINDVEQQLQQLIDSSP